MLSDPVESRLALVRDDLFVGVAECWTDFAANFLTKSSRLVLSTQVTPFWLWRRLIHINLSAVVVIIVVVATAASDILRSGRKWFDCLGRQALLLLSMRGFGGTVGTEMDAIQIIVAVGGGGSDWSSLNKKHVSSLFC